MKAIYNTIADYGYKYVSTPVAFSEEESAQRVKPPTQSMEELSGNCIETALLFDSCFEAIGFKSNLIFVTGHVFVSVDAWKDDPDHIPLECTSVGYSSFDTAIQNGIDEFEEKQANDRKVVEVFTKRDNGVTPIPWFDEGETSPNQSPVPSFTVNPQSGNLSTMFHVNASNSYDSDTGDSVVSYEWDWGDGRYSTGITTSHQYSSYGNKKITLTITDSYGEKASITKNISVIQLISISSKVDSCLNSIAWKPDGSYALIVGNKGTILKYNGNRLTSVDSGTPKDLVDIAWKPDGSYALIVGMDGAVLKYDGNEFVNLSVVISGISYDFSDWSWDTVAWKPDGSYALIAGGGWIIKYDGNDFDLVRFSYYLSPHRIAWKPDGSYAVMVNYVSYGGGSIEKYSDDNEFTKIYGENYIDAIAWKPDGSYALMVGEPPAATSSFLLKYNGHNFIRLGEREMWSPVDVAWKPDGSYALMVGNGWSGSVNDFLIIATYDGKSISEISWSASKPQLSEPYLKSVSWKPDGSYAIIVGVNGTIFRYG